MADDDGLIKEGFLKKKSGKSGLFENWRKRWFRLAHCKLEYFKNNKAKKVVGAVHLAKYTAIEPDADQELKKPHAFVLVPSDASGRRFCLSAGTDEERTEWIEAITPFLGKAVYTEAGVLASATKDRPSVKSGRRPPTRAGRKSRAKAKAKARPAPPKVARKPTRERPRRDSSAQELFQQSSEMHRENESLKDEVVKLETMVQFLKSRVSELEDEVGHLRGVMTDHGWEDPDAEEAFVDDRPSSGLLLAVPEIDLDALSEDFTESESSDMGGSVPLEDDDVGASDVSGPSGGVDGSDGGNESGGADNDAMTAESVPSVTVSDADDPVPSDNTAMVVATGGTSSILSGDLATRLEAAREARLAQVAELEAAACDIDGLSLTQPEIDDLIVHFQSFDQDCSGSIDPLEFRRVLIYLGEPTTTARVREMMAGYDLDKDGTVSFEEFLRMMDGRTKDRTAMASDSGTAADGDEAAGNEAAGDGSGDDGSGDALDGDAGPSAADAAGGGGSDAESPSAASGNASGDDGGGVDAPVSDAS